MNGALYLVKEFRFTVVVGRFSRNTIVERLFLASKNIITDKRTSLNEDKLDKYVISQKKIYLS